MEMKLEEAQICRLCGECESIYIDVFGEEGTKRFLGVKIHTKINILIDETDPLPKAICVQCLGKLEFVCDFQEECLRTQQVLRERYNLPPLTDVEELKIEDPSIPAGTSTNNNSTDKNLNPPLESEVEITTTTYEKSATPIETENHQTKAKKKLRQRRRSISQSENEKPESERENVREPSTENVNKRWLRSRNSTASSTATTTTTTTTNSTSGTLTSVDCAKTVTASIARRLRSQNDSLDKSKEVLENTTKESTSPSSKSLSGESMIQIPTSALNKVLTVVSSSPDMEVSVKESTNRQGDIEDISFTLELRRKKQDTEFLTVLAKVFPDQGSCLVGSGIVNLLENENNVEVDKIVSTIINGSAKRKSINSGVTKIDELEEMEKRLSTTQNPEELFRVDGEEIRVDDNIEYVDSQTGYACKLCRKMYERRDKCTVHVKTHLGIKQYACTLCCAKFVCKSDVMKHIRCSHTNPRPMQCPKCPKRFRSKFDLTEHDNVHKGVKPYRCSDCSQSYHHKVSLQMHVKSHQPPQNLACEYCGKVFPFRTRLLSHIGSVHLKNRRNFRCRFCYNLYSSLAVLNDHVKSRHATTYTCEICSKTFKVASKYKAHVLQHSNPKPFVCNVCNNRYASKAFLNEHLLKHEGLRKHVCQKCGASFAQASHLAAHRHVHGEKIHVCPECGRKFNRRDNMKVHRKRHFEKSGKNDGNEMSDGSTADNNTNEKISEADGLSHKVCVKCLGALEFLCDFHEQCHKTQEKLAAAQEAQKCQEIAPESLDPELDEDFDKENTAPIKSGIKRKKSIHPDEQKNGKIAHVTVDKRLKVTVEEPERSKAETKLNENEEEKENRINETSTDDNEAIPKGKKEENKANKRDDVAKNKVEKSNINKNKETTPNKNIEAKKSKVEEKNLNKIEVPKKSNDSNKTPSLFNKSNTSKTSTKMESGLKMSPREEKKITDWLNKVPRREAPNINSIVEKCDKSAEKTSVNNASKMLQNSKPSEVIVKVENNENLEETAISKGKILRRNKIVWIPNMFELPEGSSPKSTRLEKLHGDSPPRGDEAEKRSVSSSCSGEKNFEKKKEGASMEVARKSVIEKSDTKIEDGRSKRRESRSVAKKLNVIESGDEEEEEEEESADDTDDDGNRKTKKFSKITDLITDEQKEAIEKYYSCDMSAVDEKQVGEQLIFLDRKKFGCKLCDASYTRQDKCQVHIWAHLDMKPYRCNACDFSTVTVSNIRCHVRKSHLKIKPYACEICLKRYVTAFLLEEHLNTHTGLRPYACDICKFTSASRQVLSYHKTTHKPVKDITCNVCGKEFYSKSRLRAHLIIHNKDKAANMCKFCSIYLCNSEALQKHYANVHNRDYECNVCGKRCKSKKALNNHQNVHSAAKYKCTLCSNVYKSSHILKEHLLKHEGIRKYKCNICQKDFAQQSHLAAHMAVHSDKRFLCPGCQRPFNRHDNMKMHTKRCEAFLANPELAVLLTARRSQSKNLTKDTEKEAGVEKTVLSTAPTHTKTDMQINEERAILNVPKTKDEYRESFTTVVVESTIPCT